MSERVFVAASGGVDSAVAAFLLKEAGYEVSCIHLELYPNPQTIPEADHLDLEQTCRILQVPLYYLHLESEFKSRVIDYFCEEYSRGNTPNPCIRCNKNIKFGLLLEKVIEMGGDFLATGHYARVSSTDSVYKLLKGVDPAKDQSYFLYSLGQKELARVLFPLGDRCKADVKRLAAGLKLPAAERKESQDICFIPDNDSHAFLAGRLTFQPGEVVDSEGRVLGKHRGLAHYTIGQRQGMGVSARERLYVTGIDLAGNRLIIGPQSQLFKKKITAHNLNWVSGQTPKGNIEIEAKVRYSSPPAGAALEVRGTAAEISFSILQKAIAPGQSVVFYQGDEVLGGGIIDQTD